MRLLPLATLAAFAVLDLAANWRALGMVSVSEQVWALPWPLRAAVALALVLVAAHLALMWPYGPG